MTVPAATVLAPALPANLDFPRVKVLAVGGLGVGKSCLIKRYCEGRFVSKYIPTIGIDFGVKKVEISKSAVQQHRQQHPQQQQTSFASSSAGLASSIPPAAVRVNFWDGSGDADYHEICNEFYESAQGILLCYDVRSAQSFAELDNWWEELLAYCDGLSAVYETAVKKKSSGAAAGNRSSTRTSIVQATVTGTTAAGKAVGGLAGRAPIVLLIAMKCDDTVMGSSVATATSGGGNGQRCGASARVVSEAEGRTWAETHGCAAYYETSASTETNVREAVEDLVMRVVACFL